MVEVANRKILKKILDLVNASEGAYSLRGGLPNEALCIESDNDNWFVYYSERGGKTNPIQFPTEKAACSYFLNLYLETRNIKLSSYPDVKNKINRFISQKIFQHRLRQVLTEKNDIQ